MKTLIDALSLPPQGQPAPHDKEGNELPPDDDEKPYFYVLLANDKLVTHLEVETDEAIEPDPKDSKDEAFVRMVISVETRPIAINHFNLNFA